MNILLTGSSGYIGSRLAPVLLEHGHNVVGVDRAEPEAPILYPFIHGDLLDEAILAEAFEESIDCVMHLAAARTDWGPSEEEYFRDNVEATKRLIEVGRAKGIKDWFFYSTVGVLGPGEAARDEQAPYAPTTPYGASKVKAEKLFLQFAEEEADARITMLRPSAVFGPGNPPDTNIYRLVESIQSGRFVMVGQGEALKTTSYHDNLIPATLFLLERMRPGVATYIYVDEPVISTSQLVERIYRLLGKMPPTWYLPLWLVKPVAYVSDVAAVILKIDFPITAARVEKFCTSTNFEASALRALGFHQPISNEDALAATVEWHLTREQ